MNGGESKLLFILLLGAVALTKAQLSQDLNVVKFCELINTKEKTWTFLACLESKGRNKTMLKIEECKAIVTESNDTKNEDFYPQLCFNQTFMDKFGECYATARRFNGTYGSDYRPALAVLARSGRCRLGKTHMNGGHLKMKMGRKGKKKNKAYAAAAIAGAVLAKEKSKSHSQTTVIKNVGPNVNPNPVISGAAPNVHAPGGVPPSYPIHPTGFGGNHAGVPHSSPIHPTGFGCTSCPGSNGHASSDNNQHFRNSGRLSSSKSRSNSRSRGRG